MQKLALLFLMLCCVTHAMNEVEQKLKEVLSEAPKSLARNLSREERELFDAAGESERTIVTSLASLAFAEREAREAERRKRGSSKS